MIFQIKMHANSVQSALAKYKLALSFLTVYGCIVRAANTTVASGITANETKLYIRGNEAELKCPVNAELMVIKGRVALQWLTPRFTLITTSSVDDETGTFRGDSRLVLTRNGSLIIGPACCLDVGTYKCFVETKNPNGTRLIIGEASVSLLMNATDGFQCDIKEQMASCATTTSGDTGDDHDIPSVALYIGIFISGVIVGVMVVCLTRCLGKRYRSRRHKRTVAKLRKGSVSISERAGSATHGKPSLQAAVYVAADKEPQQFEMVTNPLQDERGVQQGHAFDQAPSPPPRVGAPDSLAVSRGMSPGRLTVAIHASSLQELNTVGSTSPDTSGGPQTPRNLHRSWQNGLGHNPTYGVYEQGGICTTDADNATTILIALDADLSLGEALAFKSPEYSKGGEGEEGDDYLHISDESDDYQGLGCITGESRNEARPEESTPLQHDYTSMKCRPVNTAPTKHRMSSSDDYEHLNLFSPKQLPIKGPRAYGVERFNTSYLRPLSNYEHSTISTGGKQDLFPPPPPLPATIVESSRSNFGSHASLPLPPPPEDAPDEGPFYVFLDNKGYTTLQTTGTWPRRVSTKKRYQPIAVTKETPDYLEIIASADCIYNSANDEFYF